MEDESARTISNGSDLKRALNPQTQLVKMNYTVNPDVSNQTSETPQQVLSRKTTLLDRKTTILEKTTVETYNSFQRILGISCILSISGLQFGYGICEITTIWNHNGLVETYNFTTIAPNIALSMMVSFMPLGATFGCIAARQILKGMSRKWAHFLNNIICMIASFCLMQLNYPETILIGRFVLGWCIACYTAWSPMVIRQIAPVNLRPVMGSVFSVGRVAMIVIGYLLGLIFYLADVWAYYRIMFCIPGALALIQLVLMLIFVPDSPTQLFNNGNYQKGRQVLQLIYKPEFVETMYQKYKLQAQVMGLKDKDGKQLKPYPEYQANMRRAMYMGIHLNIFRQLLALNTLVSYAGIIISQFSPTIGPYTNFVVNGIELITTIIATVWVGNKFGRRCLLLFSAICFTISNFVIAVGLLINQYILTIVFMVILMAGFGIAYSVVSWAYPAQILRSDQVPYASLATWPALIFTTLLPPIIGGLMQNGTPWPMFFFYGVYCLVSTIYMFRCVVESKGRLYVDIIKEF